MASPSPSKDYIGGKAAGEIFKIFTCVCVPQFMLKREFSDRFEASLVDLRSLLGWMDICTRLSEC